MKTDSGYGDDNDDEGGGGDDDNYDDGGGDSEEAEGDCEDDNDAGAAADVNGSAVCASHQNCSLWYHLCLPWRHEVSAQSQCPQRCFFLKKSIIFLISGWE